MHFAKDMSKSIGKNICKDLSNKYSQETIDHAKQPAEDALKTVSKRVIQTAEATDDLIGSKIADRIARILETSPKNNTEKMMKKYLGKDLYLQN